MRVPLGRDGWYLCDQTDLPDTEYTELPADRFFALEWIRQFCRDSLAMTALRHLGAGAPRGTPSDEDVLRQVAWRLGSGSLKARKLIPAPAGGSGAQGPGETPVPFPLESRSRAAAPVSRPTPDPPTLPDDTDAAAIAMGQKEAASQGVPFCEECLKAKLAGVH
jgi:hypothetical protein